MRKNRLVIIDGEAYLPSPETAKRLNIALGTLRNQTSRPNPFILPALHIGRQPFYSLAEVERVAIERETAK